MAAKKLPLRSKIRNIDQIKDKLLRPSLTSHYDVFIGLPNGFDKVMQRAFGYSKAKGIKINSIYYVLKHPYLDHN